MSSMTCLRCHRPLSDPVSREAGMGPICRAKSRKADAMPDGERQQLLIPTIPDAERVICWRDPDDVWSIATNVPWTVVHHSPAGFEWGYSGSGPADLALNILSAFVPGAEVACYRGSCSRFAWEQHQFFKREFLTRLPRAGGEIPVETIQRWIAERRHTQPSLLDELGEEGS